MLKPKTLKNRIGRILIPLLPFNRRTFDILRHEVNAIGVRIANFLSLPHRRIVRDLQSASGLSINLGSGGKGLESWVNVEMRRSGDTVLVLDVRRPLPFSDASARRVLAEHVLEHMDFRTDALNLAKEVYRVLEPGGTFRVIVPDCKKFLEAYVEGEPEKWRLLGWDLEAMPADIYSPMHIVNHVLHQEGEHLFGYDFETLSWLLRNAGFKVISEMAYQESLDTELAIDQANHASYSLYVDAVREDTK
jgi:predicted SAM-dependent methyltransferase